MRSEVGLTPEMVIAPIFSAALADCMIRLEFIGILIIYRSLQLPVVGELATRKLEEPRLSLALRSLYTS